MTTHLLKIEDIHYANIISGDKTFEIRCNDRAFQKGDRIKFRKVISSIELDGLWLITHVHSGLGMLPDFVALAIQRVG